jgi:hypothetical protein
MESFQHEQDRIAAETQALTARAEPELDLEVAPKVVEGAFAIIDDIAPAYLRANDRERGDAERGRLRGDLDRRPRNHAGRPPGSIRVRPFGH